MASCDRRWCFYDGKSDPPGRGEPATAGHITVRERLWGPVADLGKRGRAPNLRFPTSIGREMLRCAELSPCMSGPLAGAIEPFPLAKATWKSGRSGALTCEFPARRRCWRSRVCLDGSAAGGSHAPASHADPGRLGAAGGRGLASCPSARWCTAALRWAHSAAPTRDRPGGSTLIAGPSLACRTPARMMGTLPASRTTSQALGGRSTIRNFHLHKPAYPAYSATSGGDLGSVRCGANPNSPTSTGTTTQRRSPPGCGLAGAAGAVRSHGISGSRWCCSGGRVCTGQCREAVGGSRRHGGGWVALTPPSPAESPRRRAPHRLPDGTAVALPPHQSLTSPAGSA